jgi:hypothetical protein
LKNKIYIQGSKLLGTGRRKKIIYQDCMAPVVLTVAIKHTLHNIELRHHKKYNKIKIKTGYP